MQQHDSPQTRAFEKQINAAELGDEKSIHEVRVFLISCSADAPLTDLIKMARCLLEIGKDPNTQPAEE